MRVEYVIPVGMLKQERQGSLSNQNAEVFVHIRLSTVEFPETHLRTDTDVTGNQQNS